MSGTARPWHIWDVTVQDFAGGPATYSAPTAGAARYRAWLDYGDCYPDLTFAAFIRRSTVRLRATAPSPDGYDYVRRVYEVDARIGARVRLQNEGPAANGREGTVVYPDAPSTAYIHVVLDGARNASIVHPLNVRLLAAR